MGYFKKILLLLLCPQICLLAEVVRATEEGKVELSGLSGKTVRVNYGEVDGLRTGDVAKFFYRPGSVADDGSYIGEGHAVKVYKNQSIWSLKYQEKVPPLERGDNVILFRYKDYAGWQGTLRVLRTRYVIDNNKSAYLANLRDSEQKDQPQSLYLNENLFLREMDIQLVRPERADGRTNGELHAYEVEEWKNDFRGNMADDQVSNLNFMYPRASPDGQAKSESNQELREERYLNNFRVMLMSHFQMIGAPEANLASYIRARHKDPDFKLLASEMSITNTFDDLIQDQKEKKRLLSTHQKMVDQQGRAWSQSYDDDELRRLVEDKGLNTERERQRKALNSKVSHEVQLAYAHEVQNNNRLRNDSRSEYQEQNSSFRLSYELYLVRIWEPWWDFSLLVSANQSKATTAAGDVSAAGPGMREQNVKVTDRSLSIHILYYLVDSPARMRLPLPYLGLGMGYGFSYMESRDRSLGNYNTLTAPSVMAGVKFRFNSWVGMNLFSLYEMNSYSSSDGEASYGLAEKTTMTDWKMGAGLTYYF